MNVDENRDFERLVAEAEARPFVGWDFGWLKDRWSDPGPTWNYRARVLARLPAVGALLDLGTGGGEFLASLAPLPAVAWATEAYPPNVPVARARLAPLGVQVAAVSSDDSLPFPDESFDLVIDRHEAFDADEVRRVLRPGGRFITQQVGGDHGLELNRLLGASIPQYAGWSLDRAAAGLSNAGMRVVETLVERPAMVFRDVGALVYYLLAIPWQVPEFSVERYREELRQIHDRIEADGPLAVTTSFFYVEATK
jgi:SAM-dependent methyltransferase